MTTTPRLEIAVDPHEDLLLAAFVARLPARLGDLPSPDWLRALLALDARAPVARSEEVRAAVRDLLRRGGYKPTGRGKPASEYLVRAAGEGALGSINAAVDAGNAVSLHSALPVSVVDLDLLEPPLRVGLGRSGETYVFNAAGQTIDVEGLLLLRDAAGPSANAVKDAQRTKTRDDTRSLLCVVWGVGSHAAHTRAAVAWFREIVERLGASCEDSAPPDR